MQTSLSLFEDPSPCLPGPPPVQLPPEAVAPVTRGPVTQAPVIDWELEEPYIVSLMARARLTREAVVAMLRAGRLTPHAKAEAA